MSLSYMVFFPALIVIIAMIICYNQLVRKKNMMKEAWSGSFLELQTRLETIEGEIEMSRRYYNGTVRENNIAVESFPANLIARSFKFETGLFYEIEDIQQRESINVSF